MNYGYQHFSESDNNEKLLSDKSPFAAIEAYRLARTNLIYSTGTEGTPIFAITSAQPNEGKTLNCANLAISFAQAGYKTLIIDCDMRNPSQITAFNLKAVSGTSEYLAGIRKEPLFQKTKYQNLMVMVSGKIPPNPAELLGSSRMHELLDKAAAEFDYVFLDLPPLAPVSDAMVVASNITGYVLVVDTDICDSRALRRAVSLLEQVGGRIVGTLFNGIEQKGQRRGLFGRRKRGYGYGYGYNYHYGNYGYGTKNTLGAKKTALKGETRNTPKEPKAEEKVAAQKEDIKDADSVNCAAMADKENENTLNGKE